MTSIYKQVYSIDEVYNCDFLTFCDLVGISPETYIKIIEGEISVLLDARRDVGAIYKELPFTDEKWLYYNGLIIEINDRIESKQEKLKRYKELLRRSKNANQSK